MWRDSRAGRGVVGDLVGGQAVRLGDLLRQRIELGGELAVGNGELAGRVQAEERRLRLDGELVEREMVGRHGDRRFELGAPGVERLRRARIDQIEGEARKGRSARARRARRASATLWMRPSAFSAASSSDCTPSERRLTPAAR